MTTLYALGSGSGGNAFAIECDDAVLLVDAGFSAREIERRAAAVGLGLDRLAGIALTHEHGDHACGAARLARRFGAPVVTASGTWAALAAELASVTHLPVGSCGEAQLGPFTVRACPTSHDAADPIALAIHMSDGESVGVAYDLGRPTAAVRYLLKNLSALVLEANHDEVQLRTSEYPPVVQRRIAGSGGHLSNRACAELLAELHHPGLGVIVLAHLSRRCNTAEMAHETVARALKRVAFRGTLHVATQDEPLPPLRVVRPWAVQLQLAL
ncbi:MAG: MBL fold metallo-hydrolase [Gemmatimonadales bacterium]|nr:MBL fold metallo-hydrolase [Gemmatimonadales bacterium]